MTSYTPGFYDLIRPGVQSSAATVVPLLVDALHPGTVVDVGCGEGWWAAEFARHGCQVLGVDGAYVTGGPLGDRFRAADLACPLPDLGRHDLAVCLEVAEHLPETRAGSFVADLCALAPVVAFSAAIPGQGGVGHVNEQPTGYWTDLFQRNGYTVSGALRWLIWDSPGVECWYAQNLLVAAAHPDLYPVLFRSLLAPPWQVIHPTLFDARRR